MKAELAEDDVAFLLIDISTTTDMYEEQKWKRWNHVFPFGIFSGSKQVGPTSNNIIDRSS